MNTPNIIKLNVIRTEQTRRFAVHDISAYGLDREGRCVVSTTNGSDFGVTETPAQIDALLGVTPDPLRDAAPEMLEALQGLVGVLTTDGGLEPCANSMAPAERYLGLALAAIAKATGTASPPPSAGE
ncbi:hypothetical protein [Azospirillum rugosum]|uniref:Phage protein n=1 Tax=Azospirillum rugosum TaxID=416170 RepID=A0ABS4SDW1_9PROT|nr:hypothetical protein [Azospirillum rugosum]MBP2290756.1 hypothetical protein [Azospirillum rugosum]MDQ0525645.1 hypothetical protein [Azospirillum rugosum]